MKRLIIGTLLFSLWLWGFAKEADVSAHSFDLKRDGTNFSHHHTV